MRLYCGIDLHSNNAYLVVLDEQDHVIYVLSLQNLYQRSTGRRLTSGDRFASPGRGAEGCGTQTGPGQLLRDARPGTVQDR